MTRTLIFLTHFSLLAVTTFADDGSWHPKGELARVPLADDGGPIIVSVTIEKREWPFVLHTGLPLTILDRNLLPYLGTSVAESDFAGTKVPLYKPPAMTVQRCEIKPSVVASGDLWEMQTAGIRIYGILGADSLKDLIVHLDFENEILLLCDPRKSLDPPGKKVVLRVDPNGAPCMDVSFGQSMHGNYRLDTGVRTTAILDLENCKSLIDSGGAKQSSDELITVGTTGSRRSEFFRIKKIGFSDAMLETGDFVVGRDTDPAVGIGFCRRFVMTISIGQQVAFFKKRSNLDNPVDHSDADGIHLEKDQGSERVIVQDVFREGAAAKAGVRAGDLIVGIGHKDIDNWYPGQVSRALRSPRKEELPVTVSRNGKALEMILPR